MRIRLGYEIAYQCPQPTPMLLMLRVHPSRENDLMAPDLIGVSPDVPVGSTAEPFALANFIKSTLHAFTGTLAVECERLVHDAVVNQINLTRRVRSEEPRNAEETDEELDRFGRAVLLAGAPLPKMEDSRYRSRIYRGMAITV
jgi:malonyl-CoA reductase/3-hydroxypropionate dehydrogenase (NADP+)